MWLLATVGIVILLCCRGWVDSSRTATVRGKTAALNMECEAFFTEYGATLEEENELKHKIMTSTDSGVSELREKLKETIGLEPTFGMLVVGMLAKQGKVPSKSSIYNDSYRLFNWGIEIARTQRDIPDVPIRRAARLRFLHWYDETLRENGLPYDLLYIRTQKYECGREVYDIEQAQSYKLYYPNSREEMSIPTIFLWYPARLNNTNHITGMV